MPQSEETHQMPQLIGAEGKSAAKRKRIAHLMPELRAQVPGLFDRCAAEQVAEQFGVPVRDVIEESLRDLRRHVLRKGPTSETRPVGSSYLRVVGGRKA